MLSHDDGSAACLNRLNVAPPTGQKSTMFHVRRRVIPGSALAPYRPGLGPTIAAIGGLTSTNGVLEWPHRDPSPGREGIVPHPESTRAH